VLVFQKMERSILESTEVGILNESIISERSLNSDSRDSSVIFPDSG
jgi:hypothetical protein